MKASADRPWRKYHSWAVLLPIVAILALGAVPARAETGGASTVAAGEAQAGSGIAFTPMRWAGATWYGPGFYGRQTACGQVLRANTIGVAHRNLPCGATVKLVYQGRAIVTQVIDRGPYSRGYAWDLTNGAREALHFEGSGQIGYAVALQYARKSRGAGHAGR